MPAPVAISLTEEERKEFHRRCRSPKTPARLKERLSIVLLADEGLTNNEILERLPFSIHKIARWRNRFAEPGLEGVEKDLPRGGNHGGADSAKQARLRKQIIEYTTNKEKGPKGATHWTTRTLAAELNTNHMLVARVWKDCGFKPHLIRQFKISKDPKFEEKLDDVVGLYLNPPENAVLFISG